MNQVKILSLKKETHDVVHLKTEKPDGMSFLPGQAVDVSLAIPGWEKELRPFTFTSLPTDSYLEFFIKTYPDHKGVTDQIAHMAEGDVLRLGDVFGDIQYTEPGIFIAGGAGITPFISIFKSLETEKKIGNNKLIFANKTASDIINKEYFTRLLGKNFINVLSQETTDDFEHGFINKDLLENQIEGNLSYFYLCGPPPMMEAIEKILKEIGIADENIIKEQF